MDRGQRWGLLLAPLLVVVGTALPAYAKAYYSASSPLRATQVVKKKTVSQAESFGQFSVRNLTYARNDYQYRDPKPGGDSVYVETFYDWYRGSTLRSQVGTDTSKKINTSIWTSSADQEQLYTGGDNVRIWTNVCEDHGPFLKDPCSPKPQESLKY